MYDILFGGNYRPRDLTDMYQRRVYDGKTSRPNQAVASSSTATGDPPCGTGNQGARRLGGGKKKIIVVRHEEEPDYDELTESEVNYIEDHGLPREQKHVVAVKHMHVHDDGRVHADKKTVVVFKRKHCKHCNLPWKQGACHRCTYSGHDGGMRYFTMSDYGEHACDAIDDDGDVHRTKAIEASFVDTSGRTVPEDFKSKTVVGVSRHKDQHKSTVAACRTGRTDDGKLKIDCAVVAAHTLGADEIDPNDPPVQKCSKTGSAITFEGARVFARTGGAHHMRHVAVYVHKSADEEKAIEDAQKIIDELCASVDVHHKEVFSKLRDGEHWKVVKDAIVSISNNALERRGLSLPEQNVSLFARARRELLRVAKYALNFAHVRKHHRSGDQSIADAAVKLQESKKLLEDTIVEAVGEKYRKYVAKRIEAFAVALRYILMFPHRCASVTDRDVTAKNIKDGIDHIYKFLGKAE